MHQAIGGAANGQQHPKRIFKRISGEDALNTQTTFSQLYSLRASAFGHPHSVGGDSRRRSAAGHRHAQRLGDTSHGAGGPHHRTRAHTGHQAVIDLVFFILIHLASAVACPVAAAVCASAHPLTTVRAGQHRAGDELDGRQTSRGCAHELCWHGFVTAANQHHRVHGLGTQHFLGVHGHEVAQIHAGGRSKTFMQRDGGEGHGQATCQQDATLERLDQLR